jgi:GxxExxY protein
MNADKPLTETPFNQFAINQLTEKIIACAYTVSNTLGSGFLEKVYENALAHELRKSGLVVEQQRPIQVRYDGVVVGDYYADLLVEDQVVIELKTVESFTDIHMAQCLNYLKATGLHLCLLLNFHNPKVQIKRIVHRLPE